MKKDIKSLLKKASASFLKGEYKRAIFYYSFVLNEIPDNQEAKIGMLLSSLADSGDEEAETMYEYYLALKEEKHIDIDNFIDSIENENIMLEEVIQNSFLESEDAISYKDFKELIKSRGSFKRAFEDIMFSTKVIISKKSDFIDFLEELIDNGFKEMALSYLEDALKIYKAEPNIHRLFEKLQPMN